MTTAATTTTFMAAAAVPLSPPRTPPPHPPTAAPPNSAASSKAAAAKTAKEKRAARLKAELDELIASGAAVVEGKRSTRGIKGKRLIDELLEGEIKDEFFEDVDLSDLSDSDEGEDVDNGSESDCTESSLEKEEEEEEDAAGGKEEEESDPDDEPNDPMDVDVEDDSEAAVVD